MSTEPNNGKVWRVVQFMSSVIITILTLVVIPWTTWMTVQVFNMQKEIIKITEWKDQAPRYTQKDADNLRFQIIKEINERVDTKLDRIEVKVEKVGEDVRAHIMSSQKPQAYWWQPGLVLTNILSLTNYMNTNLPPIPDSKWSLLTEH